MTAIAPATAVDVRDRGSAGPFAGFKTLFGKEIQDWVRGRRGIVVAIAAIGIGLFTVLIPFVVKASTQLGSAPELSLDPTANVLLGWTKNQSAALVLVLATMSLLTIERDRGTLAWTLTKPVSRTAVLVAKWSAAFVALSVLVVVVPLAVQTVVATIAYGGVPDLLTIARVGLLYLTVPALWVTLTLAVGTVVPSTAGVAGIAFLVMFVPSTLAGFMPAIRDYLPTDIATWAVSTAQGQPAPGTVVLAWIAGLALLGVVAKVAFDREEF